MRPLRRAGENIVTKLALMSMSIVLLALVGEGLTGCATTRQVSSGNSEQCLNVEWHGYPVAGTPLRVKPCDPWRNQQWFFNKDGSITGVGGSCMDFQATKGVKATKVTNFPFTPAP